MHIENYKTGDEKEILNLFSMAFKNSLDIRYWKWNYDSDFINEKFIKLMWDDKILAGHYAVIPIKISIMGNIFSTGLSMTTMTSPLYTKMGIFKELALSLYSQVYDRLFLIWGFPNNNSLHGFTKYLGWNHIHDIPIYRCTTKKINDINDNIEFTSTFDLSFEELFTRVKDNYNIIVQRNCDYLNWRYKQHPKNKYYCITYKKNNTLLGYFIYKLYNNSEEVYCDLVDYIAINKDVFKSLMEFLLNYMYDIKVHSINTWIADKDFYESAINLGFEETCEITHFGCKPNGSKIDNSLLNKYENWYLTMGDSDVY